MLHPVIFISGLCININEGNIVIKKRSHCNGCGRSPPVQEFGDAAPKVERLREPQPPRCKGSWGRRSQRCGESGGAAPHGYFWEVQRAAPPKVT